MLKKHLKFLTENIFISLVLFFFTCNIFALDSTRVFSKYQKSTTKNFSHFHLPGLSFQSTSGDPYSKPNDLKIFFSNYGSFLTYPLHMNLGQWLIGAGAIGITALSSVWDRKVQKISLHGRNEFHHTLMDIPDNYGYILFVAPFVIGVYTAGLISKSENLRITGRMLIESVAFSGTADLMIKFFVGRKRPYSSESQYKFSPFHLSNDYVSFPAGHTVIAFAFSTVLAERIGTWWSRALFYGMAGLNGYSRILINKHWLSDVVFGSLLGLASGWFVVNKQKQRDNQQPNSGPDIDSFRFSFSF